MNTLFLIALAILLYPINPRAIPFEEEVIEVWLLRIRRISYAYVITYLAVAAILKV